MTGALAAGAAVEPVTTRSHSLRRSAAFNIGGKGFSIAVSLFTAPFIVFHVGLAIFGFWALISSFSQYASLLDFGVGSALTRYVAELHALRDYQGLARKGVAGLYIALGFAAAIIVVTVAFCLLIPGSLTGSWPHGWRTAIICVGVNLAGVSIASAFQAFAGGLGRWDLQNLPGVIFQLAFLGGVVVMLASGMGLAGLGLAAAFASIAMVIAAWLSARRVWRQPWSPRLATMKDFRALLGYGTNLQLSVLVVVINLQSDKPVLLVFGGSLRFVGLYELASRVAFQLRSLPVMALAPLMATAASATAGRSAGALRSFYERSLQQVASLGVAPLFAAFGACWPLVLVWLGPSYTTTAKIIVILGVGYSLNLVTGAGTAVARGCGRPQLDRNYSLLGLAINLLLTVSLGALIGPWGVIVATAVGLSVSSLWLLHSMDRWVGTRTFSWSGPLRRPARSIAIGVLFGTGTVAAMGILPTGSRWLCLTYGAVSLLLFVPAWLSVTPAARTMSRTFLKWIP